MTTNELIRQIEATGVALSLTDAGRLRLIGDNEAVSRWMPIIQQYLDQIIAALVAIERTLP